MPSKLLPALMAEVVGTFAIVFVGCGAVMVNTNVHGRITNVGIAVAFGGIVALMIVALGHISGAHFNPAVTLGFVIARHFPWQRMFSYWLAQCTGAILGAAALRLLLGNIDHIGATLPAHSMWEAFYLEILLTAGLMAVCIAMAKNTRIIRHMSAIIVGSFIVIEAIIGGPISGASMNPARSLGPAFIAAIWSNQWIYLTAPFIGAIIAAYLYIWLRETYVKNSKEIGNTSEEKRADPYLYK